MNTCVIVFSHSNYIIKPTGTEKCIRELSNVFLKHNTSTIQVFSMQNKFSRLLGDQLIGVNYGKEFIGIYHFSDLSHLIDEICKKYKLCPIGVHIHHLMNYELRTLQLFLKKQKIPVHLFIHDYYTVCTSINMIDSNGKFCGVSFPSHEKCIHCSYYKNAHKADLIRNFIESISSSVDSVIVPSLDLFSHWTPMYPDLEKKTRIRGHLTPEGTYKREYVQNQKIKVAFVGSQLRLKGYEEWVKLVSCLRELDYKYELHYFGNPTTKEPNVINHPVSTATGGKDAMVASLRENGIDFVFLWSLWPETYSYVYFEASAAGAVVITNTISGNIEAMVKKVGNGIVFSNIDQVISFFCNMKAVTDYLHKFIVDSPFSPNHLNTNVDVLDVLSPIKMTCQLSVVHKNIDPLRLHSFLYTRKHKIALSKV